MEMSVIDLALITDAAVSLVGACFTDDIGFWEVYGRASRLLDAEGLDPNSDQLRALTLVVAAKMLDDPSVDAGRFRNTGPMEWVFERWALSKDETLRRIEDEWSKLGHAPPSLGDVVYFASKPRDELVKVTIYVPLLNEGTEVERPVEASRLLGGDLYYLHGPVPDEEEWAFTPGSVVRCEWKANSQGKPHLTAASFAWP